MNLPSPTTVSTREHTLRLLRHHRRSLLTFAVCIGLFAALTGIVLAEPAWLASVDTSVTSEVAEAHNGTLNLVMRLITLLGDRVVMGLLLLGIAVWVYRTGRCRTPVQVLFAAFLVNPVLEATLKGLVGRSRPEIAQLVSGDGPAFPSGHVLATVGFYGVLALIAWRSTTKRSFAVGALLSSAVVIALVGFSRIYLGVHWMSDVIGGFLVGGAFVVAVAFFLKEHHFGRSLGCTTAHERQAADGAEGTDGAQPVRVPSSRAR